MDAARLAITLLGAVLLVHAAVAADEASASAQPPMFHRAVMGATAGRAKSLNDEYYPAESSTLCFRDSLINNCATFGCTYDPDGTGQATDFCWSDVYAETQLTCQHEDKYYDKYDSYNHQGASFPGASGRPSISSNVASCSWEFHRFTSWWDIFLPDGVTQKVGTAKGICTIAHGVEHCGEEYKEGPVCGGSVITIEAGWYKTNSWYTTNRKTPIAPDGLLSWADGTAATAKWPSCCVLDAAGVGSFPSPTCPTDWTRIAKRQGGDKATTGRKLQEDVSAANSYNSQTTYYEGLATVIWGPFNVANMATGEKWEDAGVMQWVPWADYTKTATTGTPPTDAFYVEPNTYRFEFKKTPEYHRY